MNPKTLVGDEGHPQEGKYKYIFLNWKLRGIGSGMTLFCWAYNILKHSVMLMDG